MAENAPTIKTNKGVRFYNAGDHMSEPMNYSIPNGSDIHCVARFIIEAPEHDFFWVPTEIRFIVDGSRVPVDFATTICQKFKDRGLVMIDEDYSPGADDDETPIARTEAEAKEKGDRIWREYLWTIVRRWQAQCLEIKAKQGIPELAKGFTKRALSILGMRDPALTGQDAIVAEQNPQNKQSNAELDEVKRQLDETRNMLAKVLQNMEQQESVRKNAKIENATARKRGASA